MLSHISEILKQFNTGQRIFVLIQLLAFGLAIYLIPKYLDSTSPDANKLSDKVETLEDKIKKMESEIIENSRECTDRIVSREIEFIAMLDELENGVSLMRRQKTEIYRPMMINQISYDTIIRSPIQTESTPPRPAVRRPASSGPDAIRTPTTTEPEIELVPRPSVPYYTTELDLSSEDMVLNKIKEFKNKLSN
jgi:hypothetical protein